jgi:hypothetical protein
MSSGIHKWLNYKYPQNYIIRNPLAGALILAIFGFGFTILYKPLGVRASRLFSYDMTMAAYSLISGFAAIPFVRLLKSFKWFRDIKEWTILKELLSIIFVLTGVGLIIYVMGFVMETPSDRLNISTFLDSILRASMIGIIPFTFFTLMNYYYLFPHNINSIQEKQGAEDPGIKRAADPIVITSQLKKESLCFHPEELIYAESDGNYVIFYLDKGKQVKKEIIRNSINSIEQQLSAIPFYLRTHRAFIVNLKKVIGKHGTTLGYRLKLAGTENRIPVSRNNTAAFNQVFSGYQS